MLTDVSNIPIGSSSTGFYQGLKKEVYSFLKEKHLKSIDKRGLAFKALINYSMWFSFYAVFLFIGYKYGWQALWLTPVMAFALLCIVLSVMHDGSHNSFSDSSILNKLAAYSLSFAGGSPILWNKLHVRAHHDHTNVSGDDTDFESGGLLRLHPVQKLHKMHRFQQIYAWALYCGHSLRWIWFDDFRDYVKNSWNLTTIERKKLFFELIFAKAWHLSIFLVIPFLVTGSWKITLAFYVIHWMMLSVSLVLVFAMAHLTNVQSMLPERSSEKPDWALHQLATTVDFATGNRALSWAIGGLNFQVEHHIFPKMSHTRYKVIQPVVKEYCKKHGVIYNEYPTFFSVISGHFKHLKKLGRATA